MLAAARARRPALDADDVAEQDVELPVFDASQITWIRPERSTRSRKTSLPMSRRAIARPAMRRDVPASWPASSGSHSSRTAAISTRSGKRLGGAWVSVTVGGCRAPAEDTTFALRAGEAWPRPYAALISMILNLILLPRGVVTSTVSPFLRPRMARPTGDSFESLRSAGFASADPTM